MGRKKRKVDPAAVADTAPAVNTAEVLIKEEEPEDEDEDLALPQKQETPIVTSTFQTTATAPKPQSHYAISSHSGEIIHEDAYVSDGSEDSEEGFLRELDILLQGSRTGLMRRGLHQQPLQLPNRQWTRQGNKDGKAEASGANDSGEAIGGTTEEEDKAAAEAEELAQLDPAQRAARLLQEKQRREEEARLEAIQKENEDNVSRDPALFSKRTAFDIRLDQIEDKPWQNRTMDNTVNVTEYFNYGLQEEDWAEYAEQQLMIRQELTDSARQKRTPNPAIVPIQPRKSDKETPSVPAVMVAPKTNEDDKETAPQEETKDATAETKPVIAPPVKVEEDSAALAPAAGGAWGAGAEPGSELARLIAEQESATKAAATGGGSDKRRDSFPSQRSPEAEPFHHGRQQSYDDRHVPIIPPPHYDDRYAPPPDYGGTGRGNGDYGGGRGGYGGGRGDFGAGRGDYGAGRGDYGGQWQGGRGGGRGDFYGRGRGRGRGGGGRGPPPQFGGWKRPFEGEDNRWRR